MTAAKTESVEARLASLQRQISTLTRILKDNGLEAKKPVRKGDCILGGDPHACASAKPYRYQQGCRGDDCIEANSKYYSPRRAASRASDREEVTPVVVSPTKKKVLKRRG